MPRSLRVALAAPTSFSTVLTWVVSLNPQKAGKAGEESLDVFLVVVGGGRGAHGRADARWVPITEGVAPHGLRHSHQTFMEEFGTPPVLADERYGVHG